MDIRNCFDKALLVKIRPSDNKARQSLVSARSSLKKALDNIQMNNMDVAVVMAYTSMFHAFRALLFKEGIKERSHICMLEYVKKNFLELRNQAREADAYRRFRHTALYGLEVLVSKDDALAAKRLAEEIIASVTNILRTKGL